MPKLNKLSEDIAALPPEAQQLLCDFVALLKHRYPLSSPTPPDTFDWENEPFVGMWSDRPEMQDSTTWVQQVRHQHWPS